jgi:DNA topoisomerase-3
MAVRATKKDAAPAEEQVLPPVKDGEMATVLRVEVVGRKTTPPSPYTEGTLINDMRGAAKFLSESQLRARLRGEIEGLGTAATRGEIIQELLTSGLLEKRRGKLYDTPRGRRLVERLGWSLDEAVSRTALLEVQLALVAEGQLSKSEFDADFIRETRAAVAGVAAAVPVPTSPANKPAKGGRTAMSESRRSQPTEPMLKLAKTIAERKGIPLPKDVAESFEACKEFLDSHPKPGPSEKALAFANSIADKKGLSIPEEALKDSKQLSAWIDANK